MSLQTTVKLTTDFIKLDALLKVAGVADSGGQAKRLIQGNRVSVNAEPATQRGKKIRQGDRVDVALDPKVSIVVQ